MFGVLYDLRWLAGPAWVCRLPTALKRTRHTPENSDSDNESDFHAGESL